MALSKKFFLDILIFIIVPIGLLSFWLIPFLTHSSSYVGEESAFPKLIEILGFIYEFFGLKALIDIFVFNNLEKSFGWGIGILSIGFSFIIFICSFFLIKNNKSDKNFLFLFISSVILLLLSLGILGKYYPRGIGAFRFVSVFSILMCVFIGVILTKIKKSYFVLVILILILSLYINYRVINANYENYSYSSKDIDKYGKFANIYEDFYNSSFPVNNSYTNYRFGGARFPFTKSLTYIFPKISQTGGYYDQGILYENTFNRMKSGIWEKNNTNETLYYLDWFGIRYFELSGGYLEGEKKFLNNPEFELVFFKNTIDYPYKIYKYKKAKPIISVLKSNLISFENIDERYIQNLAGNNKNTEFIVPFISKERINIYNEYSLSKYELIRESPDIIRIYSDFNGENFILFKEFYYPSWKAKEYPSKKEIPVYKTANDLMLVIPDKGEKKVVIYQSFLFIDYISIAISIVFFLFVIYYLFLIKKY